MINVRNVLNCECKGDVTLCNFLINFSCNAETQFYFLKRLQQLSIAVAQCNTLQQLVSQCFAQSANQDPYFPLLGPPRSQFCELLTVPLHSVNVD